MATLAEFASQVQKANTSVQRKFDNGVAMSYKLTGAPKSFDKDGEGVLSLAETTGAKVRLAFPVGKAKGLVTGEVGGKTARAQVSEIATMDEFPDGQ